MLEPGLCSPPMPSIPPPTSLLGSCSRGTDGQPRTSVRPICVTYTVGNTLAHHQAQRHGAACCKGVNKSACCCHLPEFCWQHPPQMYAVAQRDTDTEVYIRRTTVLQQSAFWPGRPNSLCLYVEMESTSTDQGTPARDNLQEQSQPSTHWV